MDYDSIISFAKSHLDDDPMRLHLRGSNEAQASTTSVAADDMRLVVQQIEGMRQAAAKWPSLSACPSFFYPPKLNREQASSEAAARYKAGLAEGNAVVVDMTGGMGVDTLAMARRSDLVHYAEQDARLCSLMRHNVAALGCGNVVVHEGDSLEWLAEGDEQYDLVYVDPARRDAAGRKVAAFEACSPDIIAHWRLIASKAKAVMIKASPMIDLSLASTQLPALRQIHVVAVGGECKEVLFLCDGANGVDGGGREEAAIHCVNLQTRHPHFVFTPQEELAAVPSYASAIRAYIYEPNAAIMKAGPYKLLSQRYGIAKLAPSTHLYTSDSLIGTHGGEATAVADSEAHGDGGNAAGSTLFPGRVFEVLGEMPLNRKAAAKAIPGGRAHVIVRNFPESADSLQKRLGLSEGGDLFVIATTLATKKMAFLCKAVARR